MVLFGFYKGVVWVFHLCFNEVIRVLQECYLDVIKVFLGCHKVVTQVFQWSDMSRVTIQE